MARHQGFLSSIAQAHREAEKQRLVQMRLQSQAARASIAAQTAYQKALLQQQKNQLAAQTNYEKEQKRLYLESRIAEVAFKNEQLQGVVGQLNNLLTDTLSINDYLDLERLKEVPQLPQFQPGLLAVQPPPPSVQAYLPPELTGLQRFKPGAKLKYDQDVAMAHQRYQADFAGYQTREGQRQAALQQTWQNYQRQIVEIQQKAASQNAEIESFKKDFQEGQPEAVINYFTLVLEGSVYPEDFPQHAKLGFIPESKQLVVEYDLPSFEIIPAASSYTYVKSNDQISEKAATQLQRKSLYTSVVAQVTIRTLHELFEADRSKLLDTIVFNGYVESADRGTGRNRRTCLVTVRATCDTFLQLELSRIDPVVCLKTLNGSISKSPDELAPVRPVMEFNMVDSRFIDETDVISGLDQRQNLMELTPGEFESLISNLFRKMGLETRLTQASRDGGVDCVAFDPRPIFGGKVVIQAKRYKNTVGVSAVRDLYGTMQNEGASKGILVTTSGYGKASFDFAQGKPLELLGGSNLLYLLKEHAGIEAKIIMPEDLIDTYNFEGDQLN